MPYLPDDLSPAENELASAARRGAVCDFEILRDYDPSDFPGSALRAEFLADLCTERSWRIHYKGVRLRGAEVVGQVDLESAELRRPLHLVGCTLEDGIVLDDATAKRISIMNCSVGHFSGRGLTVAHDLILESSAFQSPVALSSASIGGALILRWATVHGDELRAVTADLIEVGAGVHLQAATLVGAVRLAGASIRGGLFASAARISGSDIALEASHCAIRGAVALDGGFTSDGAVVLSHGFVDGPMFLSDSRLKAPRGCALSLQATTITGEVEAQRLACEGGIDLRNLTAAAIDARGTTIVSRGATACDASRAKVDGRVELSHGFRADGPISLVELSATEVNLEGSTIDSGPNTVALDARHLDSPLGLRLGRGALIRGPVRARGWGRRMITRFPHRVAARTDPGRWAVALAALLGFVAIAWPAAWALRLRPSTAPGGATASLQTLAWLNLALLLLLSVYLIALPTAQKDWVSRRAASLGVWSIRSARKRESFARQVAEQVRSELAGPELDNYTGHLSAVLESLPTPTEGQPAGAQPLRLRVTIGPDEEPDAPSIPIEITDGRDVPIVEFEVRPTVRGRPIEPRSQTVSVPVRWERQQVYFGLPAGLPSPDIDVFVELLQKGETVDVLRVNRQTPGLDRA
ncbi:MAG: hypothetical protein QOF58_2476 [Pseudonocardiales bacterium]|jgi:hypothetical protein|nr:hypothetical protein [Actinomycetota bacterium]MDT7784057.1 hypothetical protein [Pseudonocardiales bacterium]